ncbi:cupin-like domain-containing protein [Piscinibacter terrae]|uniref:Cupin-like domain-containing protein n=1 Tax=Piscinibacter terrae TaxID=2496871 RepID=A0A3N7HNE9_9BURK|nr:cupin-like domain-containing protein [Albitalea terrae]RQP22626.1 cupin-like domain-containing protein [Albitalea terrae]
MTEWDFPHEFVDRLEDWSAAGLRDELLRRDTPVVLGGAARHWHALSTWTPRYLRSVVGDAVVTADVSPTRCFPAEVTGSHRRAMPLRELLDQTFFTDSGGNGLALLQASIPDHFPVLMTDLDPLPDLGAQRSGVSLSLGPRGMQTRLRYDSAHVLLAQLQGCRKFLLFGPADSGRLYRHALWRGGVRFSRVDATRPDFTRFPRFEDATALRCTLEPGDLLWLPAFWWQLQLCVQASIAVSLHWRARWTGYLHYRQFRWELATRAWDVLSAWRPAPEVSADHGR